MGKDARNAEALHRHGGMIDNNFGDGRAETAEDRMFFSRQDCAGFLRCGNDGRLVDRAHGRHVKHAP